MDFILRGLLNLKKKVGKSLILLGIMLIVCLVILSGFGIQSATNAASVLARQKLGAEVSLTQDMKKTMEKMRSEEGNGGEDIRNRKFTRASVPVSYLDKLKSLEHVEGYVLENSTGVNLSGGVVAVNSTSTTSTTNGQSTNNNHDGFEGAMKIPVNRGDATLMGLNDFYSGTEIKSAGAELVSGEAITDEDLGKNVLMVEETLATNNNLTVGTVLKVTNPETGTEFEGTIKGIYKTNATVNENGFRDSAMLPYNKIYAPYTFVNTVRGTDYTDKVDSIKFFIDDPINVDKFVEEGNKQDIDFNTYVLDAGTREYEQMMQPIENVASFSKITLIVVTVFGAAILALIIMLSIKERINEIGILMSLGEKRIKIIGQFLVEVVVVLAIAVSISALAGAPISRMAGDKLLANELQTESTQDTNGFGGRGGNRGEMSFGGPNGGKMGRTNVEKIKELDVKISPVEFGKMSLLSLLVVVLATILPSLMIMRVNPKEILSKHS